MRIYKVKADIYLKSQNNTYIRVCKVLILKARNEGLLINLRSYQRNHIF